MRALVLLALLASACATVAGEQAERLAAYKAQQSRLFVTRFAETPIDPRQADLVAVLTSEAVNAPLQKLEQRAFAAGEWEFVPTKAPRIELDTGSALLFVTGDVHKKGGKGPSAEVTVVGGLSARWNETGSHLYFTPQALAVVPTLKVGPLDFALGSFLRSFAQDKAAVYLAERIGEIDLPVQLMLPFQRKAIQLDKTLDIPGEQGVALRYELPQADAQVKLDKLYLWMLEGRLVVLAFADVAPAAPKPPENKADPAPMAQLQEVAR